MKKKLHYWRSNHQEQLGVALNVYRRHDGSQVEVTMVGENEKAAEHLPDAKYLGYGLFTNNSVECWVRQTRQGTLQF